MRFRTLSMQNFRSSSFAELAFPADKGCFFWGPNGHGKTNLLEALGFITALRSFRTTERAALIRWGEREAALRYVLDHEHLGETTVLVKLGSGGLAIQLDGERQTRYGDLIGQFPTVVLCSQDIQLLRGSPQLRRRFLDMAIAGVDGEYYQTLRRYHQALQQRNKLLKKGANAEIDAFSHPMAADAAVLVRKRKEALDALAQQLALTYSQIATAEEQPQLIYQPDIDAATADLFLQKWEAQLPRDRLLASTGSGPHRDDFLLSLFNRTAHEYGSEGQQRALILALRLAQAAWSEARTAIKPVLLADDVLSELDPQRRERFWSALDPAAQLIATGTTNPKIPHLQTWIVATAGYATS